MKESAILRRKLFLIQALILASFCFVVVLGVSIPLYLHLSGDVTHEFTHGTRNKSTAISQWALRASDLARQITSRSRIRQELQKYNHGLISEQELVDFTAPKLDDAMHISKEVVGITRMDLAGNKVVGVGVPPPDKALGLRPPPKNETFLGEAFTWQGKLYLWVWAPIISRQLNRVGADVVVVTTDRLAEVLQGGSDGKYDRDAWATLLVCARNNGLCQVVPTVTSQAQPEGDGLIAGLLQETKRVSGGREITSYKYEGLFCVAARVANTPSWLLVSCMKEDRLYAPIISKMSEVLLLALLLYVVCLAAYWLALRPLSRKLLIKHSELESEIRSKTESLQRELEGRLQAEAEREKIIVELQDALDNVKQLKGLLPICSSCKKIRDDQGYWKQLEEYISVHSDAKFTHGICPDCMRKLYPDYINDKGGKKGLKVVK